jgi:cytochrome b561
MNWLPFHMSIGVTLIAILLLRLCWRLFTRTPARTLPRPLRFAGAVVHACLYATILAVLITGWLGYRPMLFMPPARLFGSLPVPLAPTMGGLSARSFAMLHARLVWVLLGLVGVHVLAALVHAALLRDGVMRGMFFGRTDVIPRK